jgi:hypothetical protein
MNEVYVNAIHMEPNDTKCKNVTQTLCLNTLDASCMHCLCKVHIAIWFTIIQNY